MFAVGVRMEQKILLGLRPRPTHENENHFTEWIKRKNHPSRDGLTRKNQMEI